MQKTKEELTSELAELLEEKYNRVKYNKIHHFAFQDHLINEDRLDVSRDNYPAQLEFFKAGANYSERLFMAGNKVGKTFCGGVEMTYHLTGDYPSWWEGRRFARPIRAWAVGKTNDTTRDVLQYELLGDLHDMGSGLIPKDKIIDVVLRKGASRAVQDLYVRHISGGLSYLGFKSYQMEQDSFMGPGLDVIWHDEECPNKHIYTECLMRTAITKGIMFTTFTPLRGLSPIVCSFLQNGKLPVDGIVRDENGKATPRYTVNATWNDAPHLTEKKKQEMLASMTEYDKQARMNGLPVFGQGLIYNMDPNRYIVKQFTIPAHWERGYGLDFGWKVTAAIFGAIDPVTGILYIYDEHYMGEVHHTVHTSAIKARGRDLIGVCDPSGGGKSGPEGASWIQSFCNEGLHLVPLHSRGVEPGISEVYLGLLNGTIKIMDNNQNLLSEMGQYQRVTNERDEVEVDKQNDHACDGLRYLKTEGIRYFKPLVDWSRPAYEYTFNSDPDSITGY